MNEGPFKVGQLLMLPDGSLGRFLAVDDEEYFPPEPLNNQHGHYFMVLAIRSLDTNEIEYAEIDEVIEVDETPDYESDK